MAYTKYSLTPANNNAAPPDGAPEGMLPSCVNATMRDMMAHIRDCGDGIRGGTYTMTAPVITGGSITGTPIAARVVVIADGSSVTINGNTTDIATQANTQAVGTLTINAPTGTIVNGQRIIFRLTSTNVQTFSWNAAFAGSTDLVLPAVSSGGGLTDYVGFIYNSTAAKWQLVAKVFGF